MSSERLPMAILAGGLATRLRPITEKIPKSLVEVAGKPFAIHQIELLRRNSLSRIVFCLGYMGEKVEAVLGHGDRWGVQIDYVYDGPKLLGTGGALRRALPYLGDSFFVLYGDSYLDCDYTAVEQAFSSSGKLALMTVLHNGGRWDRSNILFMNGKIKVYDKDRVLPEMQHIDYGLGVFQAASLSDYPPDSFVDLATVYQDLLQKDQLAAYEIPLSQRFYEIGSIAGLEETQQHLSGNNR